jgi:hypothetical protein
MNTKHTLTHILILTFALILVGCGGEPSPTPETPTSEAVMATTAPSDLAATAASVDALPTAEPTIFSPFPTLAVPISPTLEEIVFPTPDPAIPPVPTEELAIAPSGFDRIILYRTGGPEREDGSTADEIITLNRADSTITRGDAQGTLSQAAITRIGELVDTTQFFTVNGIFLGAVPAEPPLPFLYNITVISGEFERSISAQEGFMTPEIQSLVGAVLSEGQRVPKR